ncbi:hypothetical protein GCM10027160_28070 [Streptomyces calidiresistens]|uniref:Uncharacterized protein n=1 Tax=Streptomyces calidiresistens TaxID=1485586 RepID=A0A7W3XZA8_9ACTN|nr:hypothetical protein [Streptomyces calidiresistens]MBB0232778.1 hypothetical protein [Streptomyces calidiresistens]
MLSLPERANELRAPFARLGRLRLPGLLTRAGLTALRAEVLGLRQRLVRREHADVLDGTELSAAGPLMARLGADPALRDLVAAIAGVAAEPLPDPARRLCLHVLDRPGDRIEPAPGGPPLALALFLDAPASPQDGGMLEYRPVSWSAGRAGPGAGGPGPGSPDRRSAGAALPEPLLRAHHAPGDGCLMRADVTEPRVTPLRVADARTVVLTLGWAVGRPLVERRAPAGAALR